MGVQGIFKDEVLGYENYEQGKKSQAKRFRILCINLKKKEEEVTKLIAVPCFACNPPFLKLLKFLTI